jgi:hypothetical protein
MVCGLCFKVQGPVFKVQAGSASGTTSKSGALKPTSFAGMARSYHRYLLALVRAHPQMAIFADFVVGRKF